MPRRASRRPWGSVTEAARGKKYILRWMENTEEGRRRRSRTFYGTYREACLELDRLHVERAGDAPVPTIAKAARDWYLPWLAQRVRDGKTKQGSADTYTRVLDKEILPHWGNVPVDCAKPLAIQRWLLTLTSHSASIAVVVMRKLMDFPVRYEIIPANPFRVPYEMPVGKAVERDKGVYALAEADAAFSSIRGSIIEPAAILALFGGARTGESLAVRRDEVRGIEVGGVRFAVVPIRRRVSRKGREVMPDGDLKTPQSVRDILIPGPYGARLVEIAGEGVVPGSEWLCPSHDGSPMSCGMLGYYWRNADLARHIPFSNLRNSWRTFAQFEWGVDYDTLEVLMGHKLPGVTGSHYLRPTVEQLAEKMAEALATCKTKVP